MATELGFGLAKERDSDERKTEKPKQRVEIMADGGCGYHVPHRHRVKEIVREVRAIRLRVMRIFDSFFVYKVVV
uniref:Uncharacterized protein n=1 Tax=Oryza sativa subsp. japonica TaxID=39947 RepID=Q5Z5Z2_ORYSJ|nr:hypothetical protein [Oryza sativa Japonica Group]